MELGIGLRDAIIGNEVGKNAAEARARQEELDAQARTDWAAKNEVTQQGLEAARAKAANDTALMPASIGPGSAQAAGLAAAQPGASLAQQPAASPVGATTQPSLDVAAPKPAVNAQAAGLESGAPTSTSIASLYNAEKDEKKRADLYSRYQSARSVERASAARKAQMMLEADDPTGAVELYNTTIHDGRKAVSAKPKDANTLLVTFDDGKVQEVSKVGLHKFLIELQKPGSQVDTSIKALEERSKADANIYQAEGDGNKALRLAQAAKARAEGADGGGLTLSQKRINAEIDAARTAVAGLTPEEIKRRTAKATNTGRDNPDYDPNMERQARLANSRKYGKDEDFDQRNQGNAPKSKLINSNGAPFMLGGKPISYYGRDQLEKLMRQASPEAKARIETELTFRTFSDDPGMQGNELGEKTDLGFEVFDASGKLIGHYN